MAIAEGRKARKRVQEGVEDTASTVSERAPEEKDVQPPDEPLEEARGGSDQRSTLRAELSDTVREAALEVLRPVARKATASAAKMAVTRGPDLVKDKVAPKVTQRITDAGGAGALAKGLTSKGGGLAGGLTDKLPIGGKGKDKGKAGKKAATGTGRGRRLPVQEYVDVAVPIEVAYDQYTQFEEFPRFMHRVEKVEQRDDTTIVWHENVWGVRRQWECEITDQTPSERIAWRSNDGQMVGVVTFHRISDRLTRVYVNMDFQPHGILEKTASGLRHSRRALLSDLMRFKAYVEMKDDATGAWRGRIEDGDVVEEPEGREREFDEDEEEREPTRARGRDEDEDLEEEEDLADEEEEEPEARQPRRRRFSREELDEDEEPEAEEEEPQAYEEDEELEDEEPEEKPARKRKPARAPRTTTRTRR